MTERAVALTQALADAGQFKTKLNKLLFYADFKAFKELGKSLTGMRYARIPFGPVPQNYETVFASLASMGALVVEPWEVSGYSGEVLRASRQPDLSVFAEREKEIIFLVKKRFASMTAAEIVAFSHEEKAWKETANAQIISYDYAKMLLI